MTHVKTACYEGREIHYLESFISLPVCSVCDDILNGNYSILLDESKLGHTGDHVCEKCFQSSIQR